MVFYTVFNSISVLSRRSVHLSMLSLRFYFCPVFRTIFIPSHWLLSNTSVVETMDSGERGMNPVAMIIINPMKEYWPGWGSNQRPPVLKSCRRTTEPWGSVSSELSTPAPTSFGADKQTL